MLKEIPFQDGAEGVAMTLKTKKKILYKPLAWEKKRPELICFDADGWYEIKLKWLEACRWAGTSCDTEVETIGTAIKALDELARRVIEGQR